MYRIDQDPASEAFVECWRAAGSHLNRQVEGSLSWIRASLAGPVIEHLSFGLGNQLFFIWVEDNDGTVFGPSSYDAFLTKAIENKAFACILTMTRRNGGWEAVYSGWGLTDAVSGAPIDPVLELTDEKMEMTDWELHDFAVQVVRDSLLQSGLEILSTQSDPEVQPSLWFVGDKGPEWVLVRAVRFPEARADIPENWRNVAENCAHLFRKGNFASVAVISANQQFDEGNKSLVVPLWRGHPMHVNFSGIEQLPTSDQPLTN